MGNLPSTFSVYYIECLPTGQGYVGITGWTVTKRFTRHVWNARRGRAGALYDAVREHGVESFKVSLLETVLSWDDACDAERRLIEELCTKLPKGLNATGGGDGNFGYEFTDEVRARMSASGKARRLTETHRQNIGDAHRGRKQPADAVAKRAAARRGTKASEATREKMRQAHLGKVIPEDVVAKRTGKKRTPEQIERMRAGMIGKKRSPQGRANIAAGCKLRTERLIQEGRAPVPPAWDGKTHSEETRTKMSEAHKKRWERRKMTQLDTPDTLAETGDT
jgi:group I intron endonuclease